MLSSASSKLSESQFRELVASGGSGGVASAAGSSFALLDAERAVARGELQRNNGELLASAAVPRDSPLRRPLYAPQRSMLRDGLSDYAVRGARVRDDGTLAPPPLDATQSAAAARLADALELGASLDDVRAALGLVERVPRLLMAPLMHAFAVAHDESAAASEARRAAYCDAAFAKRESHLRRSQGIDDESFDTIVSQVEKDVPRTLPSGFSAFFASPRVRRLKQRLLVRLALTHSHIGYLQGLGDVAAVFVVTFAEAAAGALDGSDGDALQRLSDAQLLDVEADAFAATSTLMQRFSHVFLDTLDGEAMATRMAQIEADLAATNPRLVAHLRAHDVSLVLFMSRFHMCFLTRELPLRSCQRLLLAYVALPPEVDVQRVHQAVCASTFDALYSSRLMKLHDFGDIVLATQDAPALRLREDIVDDILLGAAEHTLQLRAHVDRHIAILLLCAVATRLAALRSK